MKRILLPIIIAVVLLVGLSAGLANAAPTAEGTTAAIAPASVSLVPSQQMTATTFTVSCGAVAVDGSCESSCVEENGTTVLSAWSTGVGDVVTHTPEISGSIKFVDVYAVPCVCGTSCDGSGGVSSVEDLATSFWWNSDGCEKSYSTDWDMIYYSISTTGIITEFVFQVSQESDDYIVYEWDNRDPSNWIRLSSYASSYISENYLGNGRWKFTNSGPAAGHPEITFDKVDSVWFRLDPRTATTWDAGLTWEIVSVNGISTTEITETGSITALCTISQTILFDQSHALPVRGQEIESNDFPPLGLDPFTNGSFDSLLPISSTVLVYETRPNFKNSGVPSVDHPEYHTVKWQRLGFTDIFSVPTCIEPTLVITGCPDAANLEYILPERTPTPWLEPRFQHLVNKWLEYIATVLLSYYEYFAESLQVLFAFWFSWLWCRLEALAVFVTSWASYVGCTGQRMMAMAVNSIAEYIYNIYIDIGGEFADLIYVLVNFFRQAGDFVSNVVVPEFSAWLEEMQICVADQLNSWLPATTDFLEMAVSESVSWTGSLLTWFVDDFVPVTWSQLLNMISAVIESSSATMTFIVRQFSATILDLVNMMGFGLKIVVFVMQLVTEIVTGLQAALNADTTEDLFASATLFWRGVELFEDLVGETPLVFLNLFAIGLMGIRLVPWTAEYAILLLSDLMEVIGK